MDHNPYLKPWHRPEPNQVAGKGYIEKPEEVENIVWQTRAAPPTNYENDLGDALVRAFESGAETLQEVIAKLNEQGVFSPDGSPWTEENFEREMKRLGA